VEDIDAVAGRVEELGGELKQAPTDAGEHGRIAIVHDPSGARFVLWQPGADDGAERVNEPGCLCWNELLTPEPERAAEFYTALLGWSFTAIEAPPPAPEMTSIATATGGRNGSTTKQAGDLTALPAGWRSYFGAESCEQIAARAAELHGSVVFGPIEIPTGHLAILADPQGAVFGIVDGEMDP
jgi:predicted enzyme related to lactoylglutathione lyase